MEPIAAAEAERWRTAEREANAFRGAFIQHHARGEALVAETLLALHESVRCGASIKLQHLAGGRWAALRQAVDAIKAEDPHLPGVLSALDGFKQFERLRGFLCHGVATIALDRRNGWCLGIKLLSFRPQRCERESVFIDKPDSATLLGDIEAATTRLSCALGHVRKFAG